MNSRYTQIDEARFAMMLPVCIISYGFPMQAGAYLRLLCGIATISFYILSGYLVTRTDRPLEEKLRRAILRTGLLALGALMLNLFANAVYFHSQGASLRQVLASMAVSKRFWFEFLVMNIWHLPIGENFWFIQSLFYAYVVMYLLYKWKLLKYDWLICILCLAVTVLTGELAGVIGFSALGYRYIPANFITRALPYLLLGGMIRQRRHLIARKYGPIDDLLLIVGGAALTIGEVTLLSEMEKLIYTGHLIGNGLAASGLCILVIMGGFSIFPWRRTSYFAERMRWYTTFIYMTHQLIGMAVLFTIYTYMPAMAEFLPYFIAFLVYALSLVAAILCRFACDLVVKGKNNG